MDFNQMLGEALATLDNMSPEDFRKYWGENFGKGKPLADRMKEYEKRDSQQYDSSEIVVARIDGRGFSKFTKRMDKPFDAKFTKCMIETTKALVKETNATIGYTQSDEISLIWHTDNPNGQIFFNGKVQKLCSICASIATAHFNDWVYRTKIKTNDCAYFDCRVFTVPNKEEAINYLVYRQRDCIKNSIGMVTSKFFSHKEQMNKSTTEKLDMLNGTGVWWEDDYLDANRIGTFVQRVKYTKIGKYNPNNPVSRTQVDDLELSERQSFNNLYRIVFGVKYETTT